ncbi:MAG: GlsB/YeaQ/YmgE family stress response membrane protein [Dokdonella sp.]|uniref:GlsB/YeaQ/YmgE family stress response membrane protein n=1 Tax=Dokdonella sp. TaxID=2291710 RepID=UPI002BE86C78|nr:GlsB/YeaQ/YmgE family stress response membrane protein [Dokdonella sp.]HOX71793.1 GlsB/YeaQ/YmgE family stress response membrane protein [Dokdonella sp.]HPG93466.1 GlsB/YeaQ/YmgE family stress response membrane protein [Dokdonella sp.]HPN78372.1 GlsB/YeaQ/YmgE family stress response membrane protein [Dokdonella sp.]
MTLESLLIFLLVGAIAGWLAGLIVKGRGLGLVGNIVIGIVGAFLAGWLLPQLGLYIGGGLVGAILNAMIGAIILLVIIMAIRKT